MNFAEVEQVVAKLRQDLAAGRLTEEQFKARLRELMVQDERGNWWMVGYETGGWYRHDGTDWVRADPPSHVIQKPPPSPTTLPQPTGQPVAGLVERAALLAKSRPFRGIVVLLLGLAVTFSVFMVGYILVAEGALEAMPDEGALCVVCGMWAIITFGGLILTVVITRKVWRGK
jgi:hypothetical protein